MPPRSTVPKPGITHGSGPTGKPSGYAQGCGCQACRDAKTEYEADRRAARRALAGPAVRLARDEARNVTISVVLSGRVKALTERAAADAGVPLGQWIRDPSLAALTERCGYTDTVPARPAQARREGVSRDGGNGAGLGDAWDIPVGVRFTGPEKTLIQQLADEDGASASEWVRDHALGRLEDETGWTDTERRRAPRRPSRTSQEGQ